MVTPPRDIEAIAGRSIEAGRISLKDLHLPKAVMAVVGFPKGRAVLREYMVPAGGQS